MAGVLLKSKLEMHLELPICWYNCCSVVPSKTVSFAQLHMLLCRQQLEEKYIFEANGGQLQQQLQTFASTLPWVYELQMAALAEATTQHTTLQDYLALQVSQQQQINGKTNTLLDSMLAQQSKWEHLQLIPLGLEIYQWASHSLTGLATEAAVRSISLHEYLQRAKHRNSTDADKMSQVYQRFKLSWSAFHKAQDGYMRDECREDARFAPVTDDTPLSFFISWEDTATDDYILRVLRNIVDIQNKFMAVAQETALSAAVPSAPASLLSDPTFSLGLLDSCSLRLESIIPSYLHSSTSVLPEFDLGSMTKHLVSWLHSKHIITDDLYKIRRVFQPWQPDPAPLMHNTTEGAGDARPLELGAAQSLPLAYRQALPPQQHSTLSSHLGSISFQQLHDMQHALQQVAAAVVHKTNLACASSTQQAVRRTLEPTDSLSAAVAAANPDSKLKGADFMSGLTVVHVHAAVVMAAEKAAGQSHLYAHLPLFVKAPLSKAQVKHLKDSLQRGLLAEPHRAEDLSELLKDLRRYVEFSNRIPHGLECFTWAPGSLQSSTDSETKPCYS